MMTQTYTILSLIIKIRLYPVVGSENACVCV